MMEGWRKVFLADYYTISSGLSKPASEFGKGYPFVSFKDVFWNYFLPDSLTELVNTNDKERKSCSVKKGDVFLTRTSEKIEELGMSSVAMKDYPKATFNGFTKRLRPKSENEIDPKFIGFYLRSQQFRAEITAYSSLTTRASLNNSIISRLKINLPPLKTQRKIASILSAYDDLIENNLKRIKLLEEQAQLTYEEWFVRFKFPGHETIKFDEETGLPEGWERKKLGNLIVNYDSKRVPVSKMQREQMQGKYPYYGAASIMDYVDDYLFDGRFVLMGEDGTVITNEGYPKLQFVQGKIWVNNHAHVLEGTKISNEFLYLFLNQYPIQGHVTGVAQPKINQKNLNRIKVIYATKDVRDRFDEVVKPNIDLNFNLQNQNQHLKEARDILLPRLMSGMIDPSASSGQVVEKLEVGSLKYEVNDSLGMVAEGNSSYSKE